MGMDHKAYLFDMEKYHMDIEGILDECCRSKSTLRAEAYISEHWMELSSPYNGEKLDRDWKKELSDNSFQEYCDILLTACYDYGRDIGLGYNWDGINEILKQMDFMDHTEECVLGNEIIFYDITIDPGAMGLGIVEIEDVAFIYEKLLRNRSRLEDMEVPEDLLYQIEEEEIQDAYDDLVGIYREAVKEKKGILFTF